MTATDRLTAMGRALVERIHDVFPANGAPTPEEMRNHHCPECEDVSALFAGRRWPEITAVDLVGNPGVGLLRPLPRRYYLPALMVRCVEAPRGLDCLPDATIALLSPPVADTLEPITFTQTQRAAIIEFLRVCELRERLDTPEPMPEEALAYVPLSRPLERALAFWGQTRRA